MKRQYEDEDDDTEVDAIPRSRRTNRNGQLRFYDHLQPVHPTPYQEYQLLQGLEQGPRALPKLEKMQGAACAMHPNALSSQAAASQFLGYANPSNAMLGAGEVPDLASASGLLQRHPVQSDSWARSGLAIPEVDSTPVPLPITSTATTWSQPGFGTWIPNAEYKPHVSQLHGLTVSYAAEEFEVPPASVVSHGYRQEIDISEHIHSFDRSNGPPLGGPRPQGMEANSHVAHRSSSPYPTMVGPVADMRRTGENGYQLLLGPDNMAPPLDTQKSDMAAGFASSQLDTATLHGPVEGSSPDEPTLSYSHDHAVVYIKRDPQMLDHDDVRTSIKEEMDGSEINLDPSNPSTWDDPFKPPLEEEPTKLEIADDSKVLPTRKAKSTSRKSGTVKRKMAKPREWISCLRCGKQRIKVPERKMCMCLVLWIDHFQCTPNQEGLQFPCLACLFFNRESSKTIHTLPCHRTRIVSVSLYRTNNLGFTKRFPQTKVVDIKTFGPNIEIKMDDALCETPMVLKLRQYIPIEGDQLGRTYADSRGRVREVYRLPFCLASVEDTARTFKVYIRQHVLDGLIFLSRQEPELIRRTMEMAVEHMRLLNVSHGLAETKREVVLPNSSPVSEISTRPEKYFTN